MVPLVGKRRGPERAWPMGAPFAGDLRELGVEMDSPRGRVYQMVQVAAGRIPISDTYVEHIELCLACRACETACPSGVEYGRLVEAARAQIEQTLRRPLLSRLARSL